MSKQKKRPIKARDRETAGAKKPVSNHKRDFEGLLDLAVKGKKNDNCPSSGPAHAGPGPGLGPHITGVLALSEPSNIDATRDVCRLQAGFGKRDPQC
jgi:hypothetical protein